MWRDLFSFNKKLTWAYRKKEGIGKLTFVLSRRETNYYYQPPFPIRIWLIPSNNKYIVIIVFIEEVVNLFYITVNDFRSYILHNLYVTSNPFVFPFYQSLYLQNLKPWIPFIDFRTDYRTHLYIFVSALLFHAILQMWVIQNVCVCVCVDVLLVSCYIFLFTLQRIDEYDEFVRIINVHFRHVQQLFWVCYILLNSECNIVEQEMLTLPKHLSSPMVFSKFCVAQSSIFRVVFCPFFFLIFVWPLY